MFLGNVVYNDIMATKKAQTKTVKTAKTKAKSVKVEAFEPNRVTFGVAALAAITLVVFALLIATQFSY